MTRANVDTGIDACRVEGAEFPPSAPRFRAMCLGIPSFAQVRIESTNPEAERSPFTRSVWQHLDGYAYRNANTRDAEKLLRAAYDIAREARMRGEALPAESKAVSHEKREHQPVTAEQQQQHLNRIADVLGLSKSEAALIGPEGLEKAGEGIA